MISSSSSKGVLLLHLIIIIIIQLSVCFIPLLPLSVNTIHKQSQQRLTESFSSYPSAATTAAAATEAVDVVEEEQQGCGIGRIVAVAPTSANSPFHFQDDYVNWKQVMDQVSRRVSWTDPMLTVECISAEELEAADGRQRFEESIKGADVFFATHVSDPSTAAFIATTLGQADVPTRLAFSSDSILQESSQLGSYNPYTADGGGDDGPFQKLLNLLGLGKMSGGSEFDRKLWEAVSVYYNRQTPEDMVFILLSLVNGYIRPLEQIQGLGKKAGVKEIINIVSKCGKQVGTCISDPTCKKCLDCLDACPPNDQVCAYRCITSYESEAFEQFALCILQKHNCMGNTATIPLLPEITPASSFAGKPMTFEVAEDLFIGWLGKDYPKGRPPQGMPAGVTDDGRCNYSWKVVAGLNAAYDQFNCQFQIFYRGKGSQMWYDPVFSVATLEGERVWRRRHYRVRRGKAVGTFHLSVLDNGVTSNEFWRVVHVEEDLSWGIFYYSGAAAAAGQSYSGALVVTADGNWPPKEKLPKVQQVLRQCGIEPWEMYTVNNNDCHQVSRLGIPKEFTAYNKDRAAAFEVTAAE